MTAHSVYVLDCLCGKHLGSQSREMICPVCGREIQIEWPAKAEDDAQAETWEENVDPLSE